MKLFILLVCLFVLCAGVHVTSFLPVAIPTSSSPRSITITVDAGFDSSDNYTLKWLRNSCGASNCVSTSPLTVVSSTILKSPIPSCSFLNCASWAPIGLSIYSSKSPIEQKVGNFYYYDEQLLSSDLESESGPANAPLIASVAGITCGDTCGPSFSWFFKFDSQVTAATDVHYDVHSSTFRVSGESLGSDGCVDVHVSFTGLYEANWLSTGQFCVDKNFVAPKTLSVGAIVGIVVSCVVFVSFLGVVGFLFQRWRSKKLYQAYKVLSTVPAGEDDAL